MRSGQTNSGVSVQAIAGSHVVMLGMDADEEARPGLLGFAVHRADHTEDEQYWLRGLRTFQETSPHPVPGGLVSTLEHPVQDFLWSDFTAKPDHHYTYRIVPLYDRPKSLRQGPAVELEVHTESESAGQHAVFFNRGVIGSQAYARKFGNQDPGQDPAALRWLSRGLEEAMIGFLRQAQDESFAIRAAVYEFTYEPVLREFQSAAERCRDVRIIYDARPGPNKPVAASDRMIDEVGIRDLMVPRKTNLSFIAHNKFIVLLKDGAPVEVWTGSTNLTLSGLFGHSNVGHIVRDQGAARAFLDYWSRLENDPAATTLRPANAAASPNPPVPLPAGILPIFSPRPNTSMLDAYAGIMDRARQTVCFTAAFGVNQTLAAVFAEDKPFLRFLLLEKPGETFDQLTEDRDNQIAIGAFLKDDFLSRWVREKENTLSRHVKFIHTKYMLVDPLSEDPIVISGSANFSVASTKDNDENMLIIQGDKRVADMYLGEFMRLFTHFRFRNIANRQASADPAERERAFLAPNDSWTDPFYQPDSTRFKQRELFRLPAAVGAGL